MITPKAFFPVLVTGQLDGCKQFFVSLFDFEPVFETDWYVHLVHRSGAQLGFLIPDQPSQPSALRSIRAGSGMICSFEVDNVDYAYAELQKHDAKVVLVPKSEEWGQRHFMIAGPSGIAVNIIENVDPSLNAS
jgi:catechol 2,3-dioxygenase-like lactoylglutathione lyase family enzyme